jgi:uncharacterized protein involved in type VI secretion and phage assembly
LEEGIEMSIVGTMRVIAQKEMRKLHLPTLGVVTSIFPHSSAGDKDNYECNVRLKNTELELRKVPIATQCIGLAGIPRVGDLVIIVFINGDINAPIIVGRLYNDEDRPPLNNAEEIVYVPPYEANPEVRRIYIEFPQGMIFRITDDEVDIKAGDTKVIVARDGDVVIESKANVNVIADGDATLKSKGKMTILGESIKIESDKDLNLKSGSDMKVDSGANAEIKSSAEMNVEASANMKLKGATVNIN